MIWFTELISLDWYIMREACQWHSECDEMKIFLPVISADSIRKIFVLFCFECFVSGCDISSEGYRSGCSSVLRSLRFNRFALLGCNELFLKRAVCHGWETNEPALTQHSRSRRGFPSFPALFHFLFNCVLLCKSIDSGIMQQ